MLKESLAQRFFGIDNPIGKTLKYAGTIDYKITGVLKEGE